MRIEVKVPQLPESVSEATLVSWHKKAGESVARDERMVSPFSLAFQVNRHGVQANAATIPIAAAERTFGRLHISRRGYRGDAVEVHSQ